MKFVYEWFWLKQVNFVINPLYRKLIILLILSIYNILNNEIYYLISIIKCSNMISSSIFFNLTSIYDIEWLI
jgi:hypothetical protein